MDATLAVFGLIIAPVELIDGDCKQSKSRCGSNR